MLYDLVHGNRLELPWLGGSVVTVGESEGIHTPYNRTLTATLQPMLTEHPRKPAPSPPLSHRQ